MKGLNLKTHFPPVYIEIEFDSSLIPEIQC